MVKQQRASEVEPEPVSAPALVETVEGEMPERLVERVRAAVDTADRATLAAVTVAVIDLFEAGLPHQTPRQAEIAAELHRLVFGS